VCVCELKKEAGDVACLLTIFLVDVMVHDIGVLDSLNLQLRELRGRGSLYRSGISWWLTLCATLPSLTAPTDGSIASCRWGEQGG
jgi:hypothetical protein